MKWEKVKYKYSKRRKEFQDFLKNTGVDSMEYFNFGYDIEEVFLGENPKYNPNSIEYEVTPDHTHFFYRNSTNKKTYLIGFPYEEIQGRELKRFCNIYHISCTILPKKYSFYNEITYMVVFAEHSDLEELLNKYGIENKFIIDPETNFYKYLTEYCKTKSLIEKDFIEDVKSDSKFPKDNSDMEIFKYLRYEARDVYDIYIRLRKKYKKWCQKENLWKN